ncbi:MAG: hypothetical protein LBB04_02355 [Oscillospiraceae bacterium]|nr:hypothetical protein [Oscillospiraceae bacterium]
MSGKNSKSKRIQKAVDIFLSTVLICTTANVASAANARLTGSIFGEAGVNREVRIKTMSDFSALHEKTLTLTGTDGKQKEFGLKNVTRKEFKGASGTAFFNALDEFLVSVPDSDEGVAPLARHLNLKSNIEEQDNRKTETYKKLAKCFGGTLKEKPELVEIKVYDIGIDAKSSNNATMRFVIGVGELKNNNLAATTEEPSTETISGLPAAQKKIQKMIELITKNKSKATTPVISLNEVGNVIDSGVIAAVRTINSNSVVTFRKKSSSKKVLYEWKISPTNVANPKEINMRITRSNKGVDNLMAEKYAKVKYKTITMHQHGDLGSKFQVDVKFNLDAFDKGNLNLYSVDLESGTVGKKDQKLEFNEKTGRLSFQVAYGDTYMVTEGALDGV